MSATRDKIEARLGLSGSPLHQLPAAPPMIPDHDLARRIGQGAYGEVWLARNALGTCRAVKIVYRANFKDARPYEREFAGIRRFEPLSRSNEGFVDVLHVGRDEAGGWFYYVMELADAAESSLPGGGFGSSFDGQHAEAYLPRTLAGDLHRRGRLPLDECLQLGLALTLALGHLHKHGLIHRDVKPSNIIYVGGIPKLADIGLVTEAQGANTFVGTEGFVPPEGPTSPQADLFALGKVLYEAAMGKDRNEFPEPFTEIGTDRESVDLMELNAVLLRACAPDPKQRYASAEEMHADLALLHSGGSVRRQRKVAKQLRFMQRAGAVVTAAAAVIALGWWWQAQQTAKVRRLALENLNLAKLMSVSAALPRGIEAATWQDAPGWEAEKVRMEQALEACSRALSVIGAEPDTLPLKMTVHRQRCSLLRALGRLEEAAAENLKMLGISPRAAVAPEGAIDLSAYYTSTLAWEASKGDEGSDLRALPIGLHTMGGAIFDVRGVILFSQNPEWGSLPTRVDAIRVGKKVAKLHFLHSSGGHDLSMKTGARVGHYRLHFADGESIELPIRFNIDASDWWEHSHLPKELPNAMVVWQGFTMKAHFEGPRPVRLFKRTWDNPRPQVEISSVDLVAEHHITTPMLIAISAE
ncbi:MAG TPA: hypothetical protein VEH27_18575 [Methylomirabilota bacterium]|nr:hypothetical protein [Methylomirabilota bacterium]